MTPNQAFRVAKRAVEQQESGGANCSTHGCPAGMANPLNRMPCPGNPGQMCNEPASYGPSQFTVTTFVIEMRRLTREQPVTNITTTKPAEAALKLTQYLTKEDRVRMGLITADGANTGLAATLAAAKIREDKIDAYWNCFDLAPNENENAVCTQKNIVRAKFEELNDLDNYLDTNAKLDQTGATPAENINNNLVKRAAIKNRLEKFARDTGLGLVNVTITQQGNQQNIQREYNEVTALNYYTRIIRWAQLKKLLNPHVAPNRTWENLPADKRESAREILQKLGMTGTTEAETAANIKPYLKIARWNEGAQAFASAATFAQSRKNGQPPPFNLRALFVTNADSYNKDKEKFDTVSDRAIMRELNFLRNKYPTYSEREIAARVAYYHNRGSYYDYTASFSYVATFLPKWDQAVSDLCGQTTVPRFTLDPAQGPQPAQAAQQQP